MVYASRIVKSTRAMIRSARVNATKQMRNVSASSANRRHPVPKRAAGASPFARKMMLLCATRHCVKATTTTVAFAKSPSLLILSPVSKTRSARKAEENASMTVNRSLA